MAGRGRGVVLPAWMQASQGGQPGIQPQMQPPQQPGPNQPIMGRGAPIGRGMGQMPPQHQMTQPPMNHPQEPHHPQQFRPPQQMQHTPAPSNAQLPPNNASTQNSAPNAPNNAPPSDWSEHTTPQGNKYWYNRKTQESTWTKPVELKTDDTDECEWKEYTTDSGQKYYYNHRTKQSEWLEPTAHKLWREKKEGKIQPAVSTATTTTTNAPSTKDDDMYDIGDAEVSQDTKSTNNAVKSTSATSVSSATAGTQTTLKEGEIKIKPIGPHFGRIYTSKEEAEGAFEDLLKEKNIPSDSTWEQAMKKIIDDDRYGALKTMTEKRKVFSRYLEKKRTQEKEDQIEKEKQAKIAFKTMLRESKDIHNGISYRKASELLSRDNRWRDLPDDLEKELLFEDTLREIDKEQKAKEKASREERKKKFEQYLRTSGNITAASQWRKERSNYENEESYKELTPLERLEVFEIVLKDAIKEEERTAREIRDKERRNERKNRESFRKLLYDYYEQKKITAHSKWRHLAKEIENEPIYEELEKQSGSTPSELFYEVLEDIEEKYKIDKEKIKDIVKRLNIQITPDIPFNEIDDAMSRDDTYVKIHPNHRFTFYQEIIEKGNKAAKDKERSEKKKKRKFTDLLKRTSKVTPETKWEEIEEEMMTHGSCRAISTVEERKTIFAEYLDKLKKKLEDKEKRHKEKDKNDEKSNSKRKREDEDGDDSSKSSRKSDDDRKKKSRHSSRKHHRDGDDKDSKKRRRSRSKSREKENRTDQKDQKEPTTVAGTKEKLEEGELIG